MMAGRQLQGLFGLTYWAIRENLKGVDHEESLLSPDPAGNCMNWILGHILVNRDRALLLVGFVGALRRSELHGLNVEDIREHPNGLVLELPRSKTNQRGDHDELVALPRASVPAHCPVTALTTWLELAGIADFDKLDTLHNATGVDIETGNDSFRETHMEIISNS